MCPRGRPRGQGRPRGLYLWSISFTVSLSHKKFLFRKFLMTSLYVICGPPNQNPRFAYV